MGLINGGMGGSGSGDVSGDYKFTQNESGELVLTYKNEPVSTYSPSGSWFKTSVSTGVGSLHLGGNESGGVAHSISSTGQNVGFKNEFSVADPNKKWFFYPCWQAVTVDGTGRRPASFRKYAPLDDSFLPNGAPHGNAVVDYNFRSIFASESETYSLTVLFGEPYTGLLRNVIVSNTTGAEIYNTSVTVNAVQDQLVTIPYKYPFTTRTGDDLQLKLLKEDGTPLKVRAGQSTSFPYRRLSRATFSDQLITAVAWGDTKQSYQTADHDGWVLLNGRSVSSLTQSQQGIATLLGFGSTLPDTRNRLLMAAGGTYPHNTFGGSNTIARSALPNVTLSGTTDSTNTAHTHTGSSLTVSSTDTSHTHSGTTLTAATANATHSHTAGTLATSNTGSHTHTGSANGFTTVQCSSNISQGGYNVVTSPSSYTSGSAGDHTHTISGSVASDNAAHSHTITGSTGGMSANASHNHTISGNTGAMSANASHTHTFTTSSVNGNVTQTAHVPSYAALNHFVFLGA